MTTVGDAFSGSPAETVAAVKENPELMTVTSFPNLGYDFYVGYDPETELFRNRVVTLGADPEDLDAIQVDEEDLDEEEILFHFEVLISRNEEASNPLIAMMRQMLAQGLVEDEDDYS